jgi:enoyl-CoA hydratase/carnithine racemase
MSNTLILTQSAEGIHKLQINRAEKKNALTLDMYRQMTSALHRAESDDTVKVHLILGHDDVFSAGNDIQDFLGGIGGSKAGDDEQKKPPVLVFLDCLAGLEKPVVVGANGPAIGIGTTLLLHCDLVVLGETTRLRTPFVDLGLCPEAGSSLLMPQRLGRQRAAELLLLGGEIDAHTALAWGLANRVVSPEQVAKTATEFAQSLAKKPRAALMLSKQLMLGASEKSTIKDRILEEGEHFLSQLNSPEARSAFERFLSKKP